MTRTVGQVLLYGKILTPIFPKDNFFLNRSQAMGEETPEGLQQDEGCPWKDTLIWCMRLWGYRYRLTRPLYWRYASPKVSWHHRSSARMIQWADP